MYFTGGYLAFNIRLQKTDNWKEVMAAYVRKGTSDPFAAMRARTGGETYYEAQTR